MTANDAADTNQLIDLFTRYNQDLWPLHVVLYVVGVALLALILLRPGSGSDRIVSYGLAAIWLWLGIVFQGIYVLDVNATAGVVYAVLFAVGALLFAQAGRRGTLRYTAHHGASSWLGWAVLAFALVVYPILGALGGHAYPEAPLFGMAPCPTTIATFGLLLLAAPPVPRRVLVVPALWALLAPPAAIEQGVTEDAALLVTGVVSVLVILLRDRAVRRKAQDTRAGRPSVRAGVR